MGIDEIRARKRELTQRCPLCGRLIVPSAQALSFRDFCAGNLTPDVAKRWLLNAHLRHGHTDYIVIVKSEYQRALERGMSIDLARQVAKCRARKQTMGQIKALIRHCAEALGRIEAHRSWSAEGSWSIALLTGFVQTKGARFGRGSFPGGPA